MSGTRYDHWAGYNLIPQSISEDSDLSEEELRNFYEDGFQIITRKQIRTSGCNEKNSSLKTEMSVTETNTEKYELKTNCNLSSSKKETRIFYELEQMSKKRKFFLGISVLTCFFIVGIFLILPCEWSDCNCNFVKNSTRVIWQKVISNVEFKGPFTFVHTADWNNFNFLLMARGSIFADPPVMRTNFISSTGGDLFAFNGLTGSELWHKHFEKMPHEIDCSVFSSTSKQSKDCVVINYWNYMMVISYETGKFFWKITFTNKTNRTNEIFPLLVPDLNEDNVLDFMIIRDINKIMLISGLSGKIISNDFMAISNNCSEIKNLTITDETILKLNCKINGSFLNLTISLKDSIKNIGSSKQIQHYSFESLNHMLIRGYTIQVINDGVLCPKKCKSIIKIRNSDNKTVWSHESDYSYAMSPVCFDLNFTSGMYGFIFKIWEHEREDTKLQKMKISQYNMKLTVGFIYERTVIVVFNSSLMEPVQTINMSYNQILQLHDAQKSIQPDPIAENHSLMVADVGKNGSCQIITYYSTFEEHKKDNHSFAHYTLKSYLQMYDLEKEIFKSLNTAVFST